VEKALRTLGEQGVCTPDLGGRHSTSAVTGALLDALDAPGTGGTPADAALVGGS